MNGRRIPRLIFGSDHDWQLTTRNLSTRDLYSGIQSVKSYVGETPPAPWGSNGNVTGSSQLSYDIDRPSCNGRASSVTDAASLTKTSCNDVLGRLLSVTEPDGSITTYSYDTLDNPTKVTGPSGTRSFIFDALV